MKGPKINDLRRAISQRGFHRGEIASRRGWGEIPDRDEG